MIKNNPEILAPAGSMETLAAALRCGADAVYVGGKKFSARSNAGNFTLEELSAAADLCHLYDAKLHLAVNTIISDGETEEFCEYIKAAAAAGIDAFIVQDLGAAHLIRKCVPDAVLHGSTQMTVHTKCGAELLRSMGYTRVVPSRELDKSAVKKISETGIETEIFVHGALCMSISGQCYMSAVIGSRSANRGCCGQACRLPFSACGNKNASALSLKDLSLLPVISQVQEIGVDSLKIEGRMKRPEYVASAVDALKKALDGETPDMQTLRGIFSRGGFTDGYFTGKRNNMFGIREKEDVSAAASLFPKIHELYRSERKVRTVSFHAVIKSGQPVKIDAFCGNFRESVSAEPPEKALNRPTDMEMLEKQLSRLGDTVFTLGNITADIDSGLIVPAGKLNQLRRQLIEKLSRRIISGTKPTYTITDYKPASSKKSAFVNSDRLPLRIFCRTLRQAQEAVQYSDFLIIPHKLLLSGELSDIDKSRVIVSPPRFTANEEKTLAELQSLHSEGFSRLMCETLDSAAMGKKLGYTLHGGFGLNIFNSFSAHVLEELEFADFTVSFEAKISQISRISSGIPFGAVVCGRLPLMLTRNCPIKNEVGCAECTGHITDRTERSFPVLCSGDYVEILNSDTLFMLDKPELLSTLSFGTVLLSEDDTPDDFDTLLHKKPSGIITRGLYYRGI